METTNVIEKFRTDRIEGPTLYSKFLELYSGGAITPNINVVDTDEAGVSLIPADPRLSVVTVEKMLTTNNIQQNTLSLWRHLAVLDHVLEPIREDFDYILVDSHPDVNDVLRTIIYACDFVCSPVKLDLQSTLGVVSVIEALNNVNADLQLVVNATGKRVNYNPTEYAGAIATQAREWGGTLKWTERMEYRRLGREGHVFDVYVTEGDDIRQAARDRCAVFDIGGIGGQNAGKQSEQLRRLTEEFIELCPS